jgi:hypothetical protein
MARRGLFFLLLIVSAGVALSACREAPVYNVIESPLAVQNEYVTLDEVTDAIVRAGTNIRWIMVEEGPGHIVGTLNIREHQAVVDIFYTVESFTIKYKDSLNLLYNGSSIHRNYNKWIMNLEQAIQKEVVAL